MACSGRKSSEGEEELGEVVAYFDTGGGGSEGVGEFFQGGDPGGFVVWVETWVLTPMMDRALSSFQHRVARQITRSKPRIQGDGSWE